MQKTLNLIELGGFIINIAQIAYVHQEGSQVTIAFSGAPTVKLEGKEAERFLQLIRGYQIPIS